MEKPILDNALQNYLDNDNYLNKYMHIFWFFIIPELFCALMHVHVLCSV